MGLVKKISERANEAKNKGVAVLGLVGALSLGVPAAAQAQQFLGNQMRFFTCNFMGRFGYEGIKSVFGPNERISLVDYDPFSRPGDIEVVDVYAPDGGMIYTNNMRIDAPGESWGTNISSTQFLVERGGYGNYRALFYDNNQPVGEADFNIVPPQMRIVPMPAPMPIPMPRFRPRYDHHRDRGRVPFNLPRRSPRGRCLIFDRAGNCMSYQH